MNICSKCNYSWEPRGNKISASCPKCKSYLWNYKEMRSIKILNLIRGLLAEKELLTENIIDKLKFDYGDVTKAIELMTEQGDIFEVKEGYLKAT
jgi:predicted  nucleic acid-binding Zn-ribbon protein